MAMKNDPNDPLVHLNIILPTSERSAFDQWSRYGDGGKVKLSMAAAMRELMRLAVAGKIPVDRKGVLARANAKRAASSEKRRK